MSRHRCSLCGFRILTLSGHSGFLRFRPKGDVRRVGLQASPKRKPPSEGGGLPDHASQRRGMNRVSGAAVASVAAVVTIAAAAIIAAAAAFAATAAVAIVAAAAAAAVAAATTLSGTLGGGSHGGIPAHKCRGRHTDGEG